MTKRNKCFRSLAWAAWILAVVLTAGSSIRPAWAYFTTYARAENGFPIRLGDITTIEETFQDWEKTVTITNGADSEPVYVRAIAYCGSAYSLIYTDASGKWSLGADGYYYYSDPLAGGETADPLVIQIRDKDGNRVSGVEDATTFNVIVMYESTPVLYNEDGTPYADWNQVVDAGATTP